MYVLFKKKSVSLLVSVNMKSSIASSPGNTTYIFLIATVTFNLLDKFEAIWFAKNVWNEEVLIAKLNTINRSLAFSFKEDTLVVDIDSTLSYLIEPAMDLTIISSGSTQERYIIK